MVQLGLQRSLSGGSGHRPRRARGNDAKYFPSEPSNKSELLENQPPRSDEELKPTKTLKTKLLKKCRAGIDEIRRTSMIPTSSGHQQMIDKLGDSDVDDLFDSSESDVSSCESSFACFDDASFGSDLDDSHDDDDGVKNIEIATVDNNNKKSSKHKDNGKNDDDDTFENGNDDSDDDFFEEDDLSDCEISLEDSFHEDHIEELKDEEERKPRDNSELLQLSFEGGMCVVEGASPSGSDKKNVKSDDQKKKDDDAEDDGKKPSRRNRSHSRGNRRSRSHEKMADGRNNNELSSSKSRLRSSSGGRRRPRSSDTGAPRRGSGLNRSKSSENVSRGRRPPLTRSLSSEGGLGLQRQTSRRFLERSLSKRDMMSGGAGAGTIGAGTLGAGGRRGQLSRSQSSRVTTSTSLSSSSSHGSGLAPRRGIERSRSSEGPKLGSSSSLSSSLHNEKWSSSTIPSSKRRGSGVDKMSLSATVHEIGSTSSSKRPSISRQRSVRASSNREGGGNRRDLLSRGASTTKLTDMKW